MRNQFSTLIDILELKGIVTTAPSESMMALDPRVFTFEGETFEVDCVGTTFFKELTQRLINLATGDTSNSE